MIRERNHDEVIVDQISSVATKFSYELLREQNIARNEEFLQSLGILSKGVESVTALHQDKSSSAGIIRSRKSLDHNIHDVQAVRRSKRNRGETLSSSVGINHPVGQSLISQNVDDVEAAGIHGGTKPYNRLVAVDDDDVSRVKITTTGLRELIDEMNAEHSRTISNEVINPN